MRLAIDDFGTGHSSLSYARRFPVDELKIDRSFIAGLGAAVRTPPSSPRPSPSLGRSTSTVTAEGVETPDQAIRLRALGCDRAQGYLFARPMDEAALAAILRVDGLSALDDLGPDSRAGLTTASAIVASMALPTPSVRLRPYADADRWLTEAIETSPVMMADLGGPLPAAEIPGIHARRLEGMAADRLWYFTVELSPRARRRHDLPVVGRRRGRTPQRSRLGDPPRVPGSGSRDGRPAPARSPVRAKTAAGATSTRSPASPTAHRTPSAARPGSRTSARRRSCTRAGSCAATTGCSTPAQARTARRPLAPALVTLRERPHPSAENGACQERRAMPHSADDAPSRDRHAPLSVSHPRRAGQVVYLGVRPA